MNELVRSASGPRASCTRPILVLVLVTALLRMAVILAPPADLAPDFIPFGGWEELVRGSAAKDLLEGPLLPFQDYQVNDFSGGSLVVTLLAVPFFWLFGPTVIALRLSVLVISCASVVFLFLILDRFVSRRAAWFGALLLAAAPPGYALLSCIAYGTHIENNLQALVLVYLFLVYQYEKRGSLGLSFLLGLVAGFAVYFGFGILLVIGLLFVFEFLFDKLFFARRAFLARIGGFVVGISPLLIYRWNHRLQEAAIYNRSVLDHFFDETAHRPRLPVLRELFTRDLPQSVYLPHSLGLDGLVLGQFVWLALWSACAFLAWRQRASIQRAAAALFVKTIDPRTVHPSTLFLAYVPLFVITFVLSDFLIDDRRHWVASYRYLMPLYPFVFLAAGVALDSLFERERARNAVLVVYTTLCALFVAGTFARLQPALARENWTQPGYSDHAFARAIAMRYQDDLATLGEVADAIVATRPESTQDLYFFVIGQNLKFFPRHKTPEGLAAAEHARAFLEERVPAAYARYFQRLGEGDRLYLPDQKDEFEAAYAAFQRRDSD